MTKHTPGPWISWDTGNGMGITPAVGATAHPVPNVGAFALEICRVKADPSLGGPAWDQHWDEQKANARLIACAPDLKDMLQVAVNYFRKHGIDCQSLHVHEMEDVLRRAEGE